MQSARLDPLARSFYQVLDRMQTTWQSSYIRLSTWLSDQTSDDNFNTFYQNKDVIAYQDQCAAVKTSLRLLCEEVLSRGVSPRNFLRVLLTHQSAWLRVPGFSPANYAACLMANEALFNHPQAYAYQQALQQTKRKLQHWFKQQPTLALEYAYADVVYHLITFTQKTSAKRKRLLESVHFYQKLLPRDVYLVIMHEVSTVIRKSFDGEEINPYQHMKEQVRVLSRESRRTYFSHWLPRIPSHSPGEFYKNTVLR